MGLFGGGGGGEMLKPLDEAMFKPYGYTSLIGSTAGRRTEDGGFEFSTSMSPELQKLYKTAETKADPFLSQYLTELQDPVARFDYQYGDPRQREREIFEQQSALLQPAFEQQRTQTRDAMFGSGRLGLQLAGGTVGAGGATGLMSPDVYDMNLAQSRALAELAPRARELQQAEQQAEFERQQQRYILGSAADQQRLQNLLGGYQTAFGGVSDIYGLESKLLGQSAGLEQARADAVFNAARATGALYQPSSGGGGLFGSAVGGLFGEVGGAIGDFAGDYAKGKLGEVFPTSVEDAVKKGIKSQTGNQ